MPFKEVNNNNKTQQLSKNLERWKTSYFPEFWVRLKWQQFTTAGLQPSNSMGKDLSGNKLIDIHCGDKEANRYSVTNPLLQTLIPKADLKGCSERQKG